MNDIYFMKLTLRLAKKAYSLGEVPVGAIVTLDNKIVGYGYNLKETLKDATEHAEIRALKMAAKNLKTYHLEGGRMYVNLEPCSMCAGAMILFRIKTLVIGCDSLRMGAAGSNLNILNREGLNHKVEVVRGVLKDESNRLISNFFEEMRFYKERNGR